ncbi:MAG: dienelactone hydrolase [Betaproteobacteria bacterium]|nr:dienelactone hydrolase [Betaproteobacteria bacterium]
MKPGTDLVLRYLMISALAFALAVLIADTAEGAQPTVPAYDAPGAFSVNASDETWRDAKRERDVPVKVYAPASRDEQATFPVVLFSHGLGGSREAGRLWAAHWASHGFIVLALQHAGSDEGLWKDRAAGNIEANLKGGMTFSNLALRVGDVRFAIDEIGRRAQASESPWKRADPARIGMSGHSFGAQTTLAVTGQKSPGLSGQAGLEPRIRAAIALSPNARNKMNLPRQFGDIRVPFFSVTGTEDGSVLGDGTTWQDRTLPHEHMPDGGKYLVVYDGADHMVFGGQEIRRRAKTARDAEVQRRVQASTLAFWKTHLQDDKAAAGWLLDGFPKMLGAQDQYKTK